MKQTNILEIAPQEHERIYACTAGADIHAVAKVAVFKGTEDDLDKMFKDEGLEDGIDTIAHGVCIAGGLGRMALRDMVVGSCVVLDELEEYYIIRLG